MEKTKLGLSENIEAVIAYSIPPLSFFSGIIMLVLESENKFVRFHAMQSFILWGFFGVMGIVFGIIPILGWLVVKVIGVTALVSWIVLIYNAYKGNYFKFPFIGQAIYDKIVG